MGIQKGMSVDADLFGNETIDSLHPNVPISMWFWLEIFLLPLQKMFLFFSQIGVRPLCLSVSYT